MPNKVVGECMLTLQRELCEGLLITCVQSTDAFACFAAVVQVLVCCHLLEGKTLKIWCKVGFPKVMFIYLSRKRVWCTWSGPLLFVSLKTYKQQLVLDVLCFFFVFFSVCVCVLFPFQQVGFYENQLMCPIWFNPVGFPGSFTHCSTTLHDMVYSAFHCSSSAVGCFWKDGL